MKVKIRGLGTTVQHQSVSQVGVDRLQAGGQKRYDKMKIASGDKNIIIFKGKKLEHLRQDVLRHKLLEKLTDDAIA